MTTYAVTILPLASSSV